MAREVIEKSETNCWDVILKIRVQMHDTMCSIVEQKEKPSYKKMMLENYLEQLRREYETILKWNTKS